MHMVQPTISPAAAAASCSASLESTHVVNAADDLTEYDNVTGTFTIPRLVATAGAAWSFNHWLVNAHIYYHEVFSDGTVTENEWDDSFSIYSNPSEDAWQYGEYDYTINFGAQGGSPDDHVVTQRQTFTGIAAVFFSSPIPSGPILCNRSGVLVCNRSGELLWH